MFDYVIIFIVAFFFVLGNPIQRDATLYSSTKYVLPLVLVLSRSLSFLIVPVFRRVFLILTRTTSGSDAIFYCSELKGKIISVFYLFLL